MFVKNVLIGRKLIFRIFFFRNFNSFPSRNAVNMGFLHRNFRNQFSSIAAGQVGTKLRFEKINYFISLFRFLLERRNFFFPENTMNYKKTTN